MANSSKHVTVNYTPAHDTRAALSPHRGGVVFSSCSSDVAVKHIHIIARATLNTMGHGELIGTHSTHSSSLPRPPRLSVVHECIHHMGLRTDNRLNLGCHQRRGGVCLCGEGKGGGHTRHRQAGIYTLLKASIGAELAQSGQSATRVSAHAVSQSLIAFGHQKTVVSDSTHHRRLHHCLGCGQGNDSRKTYVLHSKARWQRKLLHHPAPKAPGHNNTRPPRSPPIPSHSFTLAALGVLWSSIDGVMPGRQGT